LDGEIAVFDERLRSRFDWLRQGASDAVATPPVLIAFDMLYLRGRDLRREALSERRLHLEDLLDGTDRVHAVRRLAIDGLQAWTDVLERGYEGLVAKDNDSPYVGGRTKLWLKVKQANWTDSEDRWRRTRI